MELPLAPTHSAMDEEIWELRLYVAGQTVKSVTALANLKKYCEEHLQGRYVIEVIDLLENPQLAEGDSSWPSCAARSCSFFSD